MLLNRKLIDELRMLTSTGPLGIFSYCKKVVAAKKNCSKTEPSTNAIHNTLHYDPIQKTVQHNTEQYNETNHKTMPYNTKPYSTLLRNYTIL